MSKLTLLDVSLRDGGHRTNFHFENHDLQEILTSLDNSGIEYIEIGYRNGSLHPLTNFGAAGTCQKDYLQFCQSLIKNAKIAVLVYPKNVTLADLTELKACGVQLLRVCTIKGSPEETGSIVDMAKQLGLEVAVNFIYISHYQEADLDVEIEKISQHHPDVIYFADSNGSLLPSTISLLYGKYINQYDIPFGYHAHDNLGLAQANALAAIAAGVQYIDVSLAGMGKGIGNLKTEFFIAYLQAINIKKYKLPEILTAANYVRNALGIGREDIALDEFLKAISNQN